MLIILLGLCGMASMSHMPVRSRHDEGSEQRLPDQVSYHRPLRFIHAGLPEDDAVKRLTVEEFSCYHHAYIDAQTDPLSMYVLASSDTNGCSSVEGSSVRVTPRLKGE